MPADALDAGLLASFTCKPGSSRDHTPPAKVDREPNTAAKTLNAAAGSAGMRSRASTAHQPESSPDRLSCMPRLQNG